MKEVQEASLYPAALCVLWPVSGDPTRRIRSSDFAATETAQAKPCCLLVLVVCRESGRALCMRRYADNDPRLLELDERSCICIVLYILCVRVCRDAEGLFTQRALNMQTPRRSVMASV